MRLRKVRMRRPHIDGDKVRDRATRVIIISAVVVFLVGSVGIYLFVLFGNDAADPSQTSQTSQQQTKELPVDQSMIVTDPITELKTEDIQEGTGAEAQAGSTVKVNYKGALATSGKIFDQSSQPIELSLDQVIDGWKEGIPGMKVGGKRKLLIPAAKGYGAQGTPDGSIPPNSDLVFEVELVEVK